MEMRSILIILLVGLVAGWLASFVVGGGGILRYILWGVIGSFVGSFLFRQLNINLGIGSPLVSDILVATVGAIVVVLLARLIA
jgi:uncharacterized membrane protein YeaQ/YmgE (transglycosylase-associated protein family)